MNACDLAFLRSVERMLPQICDAARIARETERAQRVANRAFEMVPVPVPASVMQDHLQSALPRK
jgi:hypothetical protein